MNERQLHNQIHTLNKEITRLKSIVDEYPKTADGVAVVPGMKVFENSQWGGMKSLTVWSVGDCGITSGHDREHTLCYDCGGMSSIGTTVRMDYFYSTREAAEAALKEQTQ